MLEDNKNDPNKIKRKFSSFFKSLVIELDKDLYGPDNHLVEWHRTHTTQVKKFYLELNVYHRFNLIYFRKLMDFK